MTRDIVAHLIERLRTDAAFRSQLESDPANTLARYDLTTAERAALIAADLGQRHPLAVGTRVRRPLLANLDRARPDVALAPVVDPATIQPGYTVFAHPAGRTEGSPVGQFVGTVLDVIDHRGVHYVHVRSGIEQANELFIPLAAVRAVVHHQVHLNLSPEDLVGAAWHVDPAPARV
jgi:hypothetical protein